jgi:hypothetical protein
MTRRALALLRWARCAKNGWERLDEALGVL